MSNDSSSIRPSAAGGRPGTDTGGLAALIELVCSLCDAPFDAPTVGTRLSRSTADTDATANWQSIVTETLSACGVEAHPTWLTLEEAASSIRPGQATIAFRQTDANPGGWVVLADHRGKRVLRSAAVHDSEWVETAQLASELDATGEQRMPWLVCDPTLTAAKASSGGGSGLPPFNRLAALISLERSDLWSVVMFGLLVGLLTLATPIAVQQLVNSVALGGLMQPVIILALLLFAGLSMSAALTTLQAYIAEIVQRRIFVRVVSEVSTRLSHLKAGAFDKVDGPELVNRFFDVVTVQKVGTTLLLDGVGLALQTVIGLFVLSFYHPLMLAFSVLLLAGIATIVWVFGRGAVQTAIAESKTKYAMAAWLEDMARTSDGLRNESAAAFASRRTDQLARNYLSARRNHYKIVLRQLAGSLGLQVLASAALLGLGGALVIAGQLTIGQLVASELIVTGIVGSFAKLGKHLESYYDLLAAVDKLGALFDLPMEQPPPGDTPAGEGPASLTFGDMGLAAGAAGSADVLSIAPGERVAFHGSARIAGLAIADIVTGVRAPGEGYVLIDGLDARDLDLADTSRGLAAVRPDDVMSSTVRENVALGRPEVSAARCRDSLAVAGLTDAVAALPNDIDTMLLAHGRPLTAHEVARLMLARAVAGRPRLLVVDEASVPLASDRSAVDIAALLDPDAPWTLIVVNASEETAARCDRVIEMRAKATAPPATSPRSEEMRPGL